MANITELKSLSRFSTTSLYDEGSSSFWTPIGGGGTPTLLANGMGYVMQQDQYLIQESIGLDIYSNMALSFWLYPVHPGVVLDENNNTVKSLNLTLMHFVNDNATDEYGGLPIFRLYETTSEDGTNSMHIAIANYDGIEYEASTASYAPGQWHYFWISYNGLVGNLSTIIDGVTRPLASESGVLPTRLDADSVTFYINRQTEFGQDDWANNYGYLDNLMVLNGSFASESYVERIISMGINYFIDQSLLSIEHNDFGVFMDDPTAIKTTAMVQDGSSVYSSRSDGKVIKGSPVLWDMRRNFSEPNEGQNIQDNEDRIFTSADNKSSTYDVSGGVLKILNCIIRL